MLDVSIRPNLFLGMRIYDRDRDAWLEITTIFRPNIEAITDRGVSILNSTLYSKHSGNRFRLPGEEGCPVDPKAPKSCDDLIFGAKYWWYSNRYGWEYGLYICPYFTTKDIALLDMPLDSKGVKSSQLILDRTNLPQSKLDLSQYPNTCPLCNAPAYIGLNQVECSKNCNK